MTDPPATSSRQGPVQASAAAVLAVYRASKAHLPRFVVYAVEGVGHTLQVTAGKVINVGEEWMRRLPFGEKVRLYATVLRGWLAYRPDYDQFVAYLKTCYRGEWSRGLSEAVAQLYTRLSAWKGVQDVMYISAFLLAEGNQKLQDTLVSTWNKVQHPISLLQSVQNSLQVTSLSQSLYEKVRIFTSLTQMSDQLRSSALSLQAKGRHFLKSAKDIADRTAFLLYRATDQSVEYSLRIIDERLVSRISSPPAELGLRGEARLVDMEHRLRLELTQFLTEKKQVFRTSFVYTSVQATMQAGVRVYRHTSEAVASSELPEVVKAPIDSVLVFVGMGAILAKFDKSVWTRLDMDGDGVVTLGDLCQALSPRRALKIMLNGYSMALGWEQNSGEVD